MNASSGGVSRTGIAVATVRPGSKLAIALLASALAALPALPASATDACGGLRFENGVVVAPKPLPAVAKLTGPALDCAKAVGAALAGRAQLRSVTIAARVSADRRADGATIAAAWMGVLTAAGIPAARISSMVPTGAPGTQPEVSIAYREPQRRPVALVQALTGMVKSGTEPAQFAIAGKGTTLSQGDHVQTGKASFARLALADGSFIALAADSEIKLGRVELTKDLKRAVRIDLIRGKVEAIAEPQGQGSSFDVVTRTAVAGVRGTRFRVGVADEGATAVETVTGAVELQGSTGSKGTVMVEAGKASRVDASGTPAKPRDLLPATSVVGPLKGFVERDVVLRWTAVPGAKSYWLDFGADGELATEQQRFAATTAELALPSTLPPGHWFWRVIAVDADGFEGLPSKTYSLAAADK